MSDLTTKLDGCCPILRIALFCFLFQMLETYDWTFRGSTHVVSLRIFFIFNLFFNFILKITHLDIYLQI